MSIPPSDINLFFAMPTQKNLLYSGPQKISPFKPDISAAPSGYENMWMNNPYLNSTYRHSPFQKLIEAFGFRSKYDEYRDSMSLNAQEYQAQLLDKAHNEQYDSAAAQAQRMREAGINPDLSGVQAGESSPMQNDPNGPISPDADDVVGTVTGFGNLILSAFTGGLGLAKDTLSLGSIRNDVNAGRIQNSKDIVDFALQSATNFIPAEYDPENSELLNQASGLGSEIVGQSLSRKQRKQFRNAISAFYRSAPTSSKNWESWLKNIGAKRDYFVGAGSEFNASEDVLRVITDELSSLSDEIYKKSFSLNKQSQDVQSQSLGVQSEALSNEAVYQDKLNPVLKASSENAQYQNATSKQQINSMLNEHSRHIISRLDNLADEGGFKGAVASAVMLFVQVLMLSNSSASSYFK